MTSPLGKYSLHVVAGADLGARMEITDRPRAIGRSRGVDMVLRDRTVSRRHLEVVAIDGGVRVSVCADAAPFVVDGKPMQSFDAKPGERLMLGNTVLLISAPASEGRTHDTPEHAPSEVKTLLSGAALDVRGLAGVFALVEALDKAADAAAVKERLLHWARGYASAETVEFLGVEEGDDPPTANPTEVLVRTSPSETLVTVPAHTTTNAWITFGFRGAGPIVADSTRRLLVVAGRICASRLGQLRVQRMVEEERAALRTMALGSAREFIGTSVGASQVARLLPRLSTSDAILLVNGETGTGKSFVARLIHESGPRAAEPLRVLNCAAIPASLIEAELFGHERGAFTGAVASRAGALEAAGAGTLFLDEIGELPLASQSKLLRVLEERRFERIGSNRTLQLRARVIAATNRDLEQMVAAGEFRRDLFFRVSVVKLKVPPLRDRAQDIPLLARYILADLLPSAGRRIDGISPEALEALEKYPWPGNVRELRNVLEHAIVMGDEPWIRCGDLPESVAAMGVPPPLASTDPRVVTLPAELAWLERRAIEVALEATSHNRSKAAALLGIPRSTLYHKLGLTGRPPAAVPPGEDGD
jgi:DNA-binding NtrC family response regulator